VERLSPWCRSGGRGTRDRWAVKPNTSHGIARHIAATSTVGIGMALGATHLLGLPIDDKGLEAIAFPFLPLPAVGHKRWTNHIDLLRGLGGDEEVRIDIAAVEHGDAWENLTIGSVLWNGGGHDTIVRSGRCRHPWRHAAWIVGITGFSEVDLLIPAVEY
jgi:hypothetical protein